MSRPTPARSTPPASTVRAANSASRGTRAPFGATALPLCGFARAAASATRSLRTGSLASRKATARRILAAMSPPSCALPWCLDNRAPRATGTSTGAKPAFATRRPACVGGSHRTARRATRPIFQWFATTTRTVSSGRARSPILTPAAAPIAAAGGVCDQTQAAFLQADITAGLVTAPGNAPSTTCQKWLASLNSDCTKCRDAGAAGGCNRVKYSAPTLRAMGSPVLQRSRRALEAVAFGLGQARLTACTSSPPSPSPWIVPPPPSTGRHSSTATARTGRAAVLLVSMALLPGCFGGLALIETVPGAAAGAALLGGRQLLRASPAA
jgi:hypothetical protein